MVFIILYHRVKSQNYIMVRDWEIRFIFAYIQEKAIAFLFLCRVYLGMIYMRQMNIL